MIKKALTLAIAATITGLTGCGGSSSPTDTLSQPSVDQGQAATTEDVGQETIAQPVTSKGVITGFGSVIVNGVHFKTQKSVFRDEDGESSEDRLTIGMEVEIRGTLNEDGTEGEAELIEFDPHIEGLIEEIDVENGSLVVLGQSIYIDELTNIEDVEFAELSVGDRVEISAQLDDVGDWIATYIALQPEEEGDTTVQLRGEISEYNAEENTFVLGDLTIDLSVAEIVDAPESGLVDGLSVKVEADEQPIEGVLIADLVEVEILDLGDEDEDLDGDNEGDENAEEDGGDGEEENTEQRRYHIDGIITAFESAESFEVNGTPITTDGDTHYQHGDAESLELGMKVKVKGVRDGEDGILAHKIHIDKPGLLKIAGEVEAIDLEASTLTLMGVVIEVGEQTHFKDKSKRRDRYLSLDDFAVGDEVKVTGFVQEEGNILAKKLERTASADVEEDGDDNDSGNGLVGPASNITGTSFVVNEVTVNTNDSTSFAGFEGESLTSEEFYTLLEDGTFVTVSGETDEAGDFIATSVKLDIIESTAEAKKDKGKGKGKGNKDAEDGSDTEPTDKGKGNSNGKGKNEDSEESGDGEESTDDSKGKPEKDKGNGNGNGKGNGKGKNKGDDGSSEEEASEE